MFALSILLAIYSYGIFALGILSILTPQNILGFTLSWILVVTVYLFNRKPVSRLVDFTATVRHIGTLPSLAVCSLLLIFCQALVNFIGAAGPELAFDSLWYHLSLPKIWLMENTIRFLPGAVFKYSVMPKFMETIYTGLLGLGFTQGPQFLHYIFGIFILIPLYRISRRYLDTTGSFLVLLLFYTNLVVGWESVTAYVELARTFFEVLALQLFLEKKITASAITLGLAITTKLISGGSLAIFILLLIWRRYSAREISTFVFFCLLIPVPWLIFALIFTGNPFYPVFSSMYPTQFSPNLTDFWILFTQSVDPISPLYLISAPLLIFFSGGRKWGRGVAVIFLYCLFSLAVWFIIPRTGGGRFILPYLPAFSFMTVWLIFQLKDLFIKKLLITLTIGLAFVSIAYRFAANLKYVPVVVGKQSVQSFLSGHLNYSFGDYSDTDNYLSTHITSSDHLLIAGINNLYYLPDQIKFHHISEYPESDIPLETFNYLLVRRPDSDFFPPENWKLVHQNHQTHTEIYLRK